MRCGLLIKGVDVGVGVVLDLDAVVREVVAVLFYQTGELTDRAEQLVNEFLVATISKFDFDWFHTGKSDRFFIQVKSQSMKSRKACLSRARMR